MKEEFTINHHVLVPKHIKLTKEEADVVLKSYNVSLKQLPKIKIEDPAIKAFNPELGDIIKIIRKSPTNNESIFYRVVISG